MVARYIKELLQESDEVIVQDLGTFHTSYHSAEIHPVSHAFAAPNKNISFQTKIKVSNLLLENYIAQKERISVEEAKEEVQKFVSTLKVSLGVEKRAALEDIGELILQVSDEIEFKQNKQSNILNDSFGLPEIYAKPIERNGASQQNVAISTTNKPSSLKQKAPTEEPKSTWGTIAAIGSLAFVVLAVVYVVAVDSSLNPFNALLGRKTEKKDDKKKQEEVVVQSDNLTQENNTTPTTTNENSDATNTNANEDNIEKNKQEEQKKEENQEIAKQEANNTVVDEKTVEEKPEKPKDDGILLGDRTNQFYIVIGGFSAQNNAYKKVSEAKAKGVENIKIVPPFDAKRLYRVAVGAFPTREQAEASLEEVKNTFSVDAWVLKY
ncbi:MAG: hypothetical protein OHK0045_16150 [Raineya sp.]